MSTPIEDYALIGDCETAALVGRDGSIDWLCWPRFDSAACFAALLGTSEHGCWRIAPAGEVRDVRRNYRDATLILETRFRTEDGEALLIDFMPPRDHSVAEGTPARNASDLVRIVRGVRGRVRMRMELILRFDYGAIVPWVSRLPDGSLRAVAGQDMTVLHTDVELKGENLRTVAEFYVGEKESRHFTLMYGPSHLPPPAPLDPRRALRKTEMFWSRWAGRCEPVAEYSAAVTRSLITLKALTYAPTGGLVAAPTASLPEAVGGERNWDYRFCWLRDATLTLLALMNSGYYEEATSWRDWLLRAAAGSPDQIQIMYGLAGERRLTEWNVSWLPGYEGSLPVRIGNAAHGQLQIDVFGEVMDALHQGRKGSLPGSEAGWALQRALVAHLENVWDSRDQGIWEVRGGARHFTYSKVMAWVALDRAIRTVEDFGFDGPIERWRALRQKIHDDVCTNGFDAEIGSFVQSYGSRALDASLLLLPTIGFLPHDDERIVGTVAAVERQLLRNGFVLRYDAEETDDGLAGEEGAFLACSFWLADAWLMQGRHDDARTLFERLLALRNDVGLLAEEYDPRLKRQVGNFPQAFSHIALVNTAHNLAGVVKPAEQRGQQGVPAS